ncbi:MAG: double zinc ribbon domain-containing protein [Candidatus Heimdallarchaeaceae archaeon]
MKCLACWEDMPEATRICNHCGSDQKEVKDYFVLALLKQQKRKIVVPEETDVLKYILEVDPESKNEITITGNAEPLPPYQPQKSSLLGSITGQRQNPPPKPIGQPIIQQPSPQKPKEKTLVCPSCQDEVPLRKFCKFCGFQLQRDCNSCGTANRVTAKFCTKCGSVQKPLETNGNKEQT